MEKTNRVAQLFKTCSHKNGEFSLTRVLLIVGTLIVLFKFLVTGWVIRGMQMPHEMPQGWIELEQMLVLLYVATHNISLHLGRNSYSGVATAVLDRMLPNVQDEPNCNREKLNDTETKTVAG